MTQKLFAFAKGECAAESPDNPMFQEALLGGHLFLMVLKVGNGALMGNCFLDWACYVMPVNLYYKICKLYISCFLSLLQEKLETWLLSLRAVIERKARQKGPEYSLNPCMVMVTEILCSVIFLTLYVLNF